VRLQILLIGAMSVWIDLWYLATRTTILFDRYFDDTSNLSQMSPIADSCYVFHILMPVQKLW